MFLYFAFLLPPSPSYTGSLDSRDKQHVSKYEICHKDWETMTIAIIDSFLLWRLFETHSPMPKCLLMRGKFSLSLLDYQTTLIT